MDNQTCLYVNHLQSSAGKNGIIVTNIKAAKDSANISYSCIDRFCHLFIYILFWYLKNVKDVEKMNIIFIYFLYCPRLGWYKKGEKLLYFPFQEENFTKMCTESNFRYEYLITNWPKLKKTTIFFLSFKFSRFTKMGTICENEWAAKQSKALTLG